MLEDVQAHVVLTVGSLGSGASSSGIESERAPAGASDPGWGSPCGFQAHWAAPRSTDPAA